MRYARALNGLFLALTLTLLACGETVTRNPLPAALVNQAKPLGLPGLRTWGDTLTKQELEAFTATNTARLKATYGRAIADGHPPPVLNFLGLSGGGQWGAFGAGVLKAWTESGTRPEFTGVSGISTGSIIAPFAFLGPKYDHVLEEIYTLQHQGPAVE